MDFSTPGFLVLHCVLKLAQTHVHWVSDAMQPSRLLLPLSLSALSLFQHQGIFQWVGSSHQMVQFLELQLQHQSFQCIFRVEFLLNDYFDLLAFQRNLKSLLQHYNWKVSILCIPPPLWFNPHIHTWLLEKNIALNRWSLVGKVIYLLSNMLSSFAIIFLLRSKCLLILWLQSLLWFWSPRKENLFSFHFSHLFAMKWWEQMPWSFCFLFFFFFLEYWVLSHFFTLLFHSYQETF